MFVYIMDFQGSFRMTDFATLGALNAGHLGLSVRVWLQGQTLLPFGVSSLDMRT